jgi:hypothetical protein
MDDRGMWFDAREGQELLLFSKTELALPPTPPSAPHAASLLVTGILLLGGIK